VTVLAAVTPPGAGKTAALGWDVACQDGNGRLTILPGQDPAKGASAQISANKVSKKRDIALIRENAGLAQIEQDLALGQAFGPASSADWQASGQPAAFGGWLLPRRADHAMPGSVTHDRLCRAQSTPAQRASLPAAPGASVRGSSRFSVLGAPFVFSSRCLCSDVRFSPAEHRTPN
jgi:hypothetical protein